MEDSIKYVNIDDLIPGALQAHFENIGDDIDNLANSISKHGIIVPLLVREKGMQQYEILLGNRRYSAAKQVGLKQIPVIIVDADDEKALDIIISDNIQRRELTAKEEAYLYDKDLEYTNNNEKSLSDKLGIPIDRIISKLKHVRKGNEEPKESINNTNINNPTNNNISNNSSINQDIVSLSALNKEEREDSNMNNDIINNQNLNADPSKIPTTQQSAPEPTFGGRFFPSLEDEPTNMNINQGNSSFSMPNNNTTSQSLIDLTDTSTPTNNIPQNNNEVYNSTLNNPNNIQQEQPATPNLDALSTSIIDNNQYQINQPMPSFDSQPTYDTGIPSNIENNNIGIETQNNINQVPQMDMNPSMNINSPIESSNQEPSYNLNNNQPMAPTIDDNQFVEQNNDYNQISESNIDNTQVPSFDNNIATNSSTDMVNEAMNYNNPVSTEEPKDIIPVVNMIKSLAINIENLGYKLNISEEKNKISYTINIEVEK